MTKGEKRGLVSAFFVLTIIFFVAILLSFYLVLPKDKISDSTKYYYLESSIEYFKTEASDSLSLDFLIKKGYAKKKSELKEKSCSYKTSYLTKNNNLITLTLDCKNYTKDLTIKINEEGENNDN